MGGEHLPGSASQGHNSDVFWREGWEPAAGTKAADLATNTNHVTTAQMLNPQLSVKQALAS